jgi:hypothetical protein
MQENLPSEESHSEELKHETLNETQPAAQAGKPASISDEDLSDVVFGQETEELPVSITESEEKEEEKEEEDEFYPEEMSLDVLSEAFLQRLESGVIFSSQKNFKKIRERFNFLSDELKNKAREAYLSEGGEADYFEFKAPTEVDALRRKLDETAQKFKELKQKKERELAENVLKKQDIIQELTQLIENESDIAKANETFRQLQERWKSTGPVPQLKFNDLNQSYRLRLQQFYQSLQIHKELFRIELSKNLEQKERIAKGVESLLKMPSINKALEFLHEYHKQWRETGPVPRTKNEALWQRFKAASDAVYRRREEHVNRLNEERKKNLEAKNTLCEEMEQLAEGTFNQLSDFRETDKKVAELDKRWRATGRVPKEFNDSIWTRFREARKAYNAKRAPLMAEAEAHYRKNLEAKTRLCEKAEALAESTDWKNTTTAFVRLQEDWKKTGPVSRDMNDKIWKRFRAAADAFFTKKEAFFKALPDVEAANLVAKREIINRMGSYAHSERLEDSFAAMDAFRKEFFAAGHVSFKEKPVIEKEFDEAVKSFFGKINIDPAERKRIEFRNKTAAMLDSPDGEEQLRKERTGIRIRLEKLREEVNQLENNIRFFGNSKNAEALVKPYLDKIERAKGEMKDLEDKQNQLKKIAKQLEGPAKK